MLGLMQQRSLTIDTFLTHAARWHGDREIVSRSVEGPIERTTYARLHDRARRISAVLLDWGVAPGDRIGTLAWNTARHMEVWYGVMGIGAVCHTLNPRLFPQQIAWIADHAADRVIFLDLTFVPILQTILGFLPLLERIVVLTDSAHLPAFDLSAAGPLFRGVADLESLIDTHGPEAVWGGFDENSAAALCYTSGTTGDPKGVLYSHRSNYLHTMVALQPDAMGLSARDTILPIVPMFHANAWGVVFAAPAVGAKIVMPGARMDGPSVYELLETEGVTISAAVPTVWQMLLTHLQATGARLETLNRVIIGGAACSETLIRAFQDDYGVEVIHAWGMTETSPIGTLSHMTANLSAATPEAQLPYRLKQGRPPVGIDLKLTDNAGTRLAHDGRSVGALKVRGPFVAAGYFRRPEENILDEEGFFDTGDIATIDEMGFMQITDRAKDVVKSGGEWISSIEIETIAIGHPKAQLAAVIGAPHPKWDERPVLIVKLKPGTQATAAEFKSWLHGRIAKWWLPDDVVFVDDIPLGATGKIDKKAVRLRMIGYELPDVRAMTPGRLKP